MLEECRWSSATHKVPTRGQDLQSLQRDCRWLKRSSLHVHFTLGVPPGSTSAMPAVQLPLPRVARFASAVLHGIILPRAPGQEDTRCASSARGIEEALLSGHPAQPVFDELEAFAKPCCLASNGLLGKRVSLGHECARKALRARGPFQSRYGPPQVRRYQEARAALGS
jgi:hypothetical protein